MHLTRKKGMYIALIYITSAFGMEQNKKEEKVFFYWQIDQLPIFQDAYQYALNQLNSENKISVKIFTKTFFKQYSHYDQKNKNKNIIKNAFLRAQGTLLIMKAQEQHAQTRVQILMEEQLNPFFGEFINQKNADNERLLAKIFINYQKISK